MSIDTACRYMLRPESTISGKAEKWFRLLTFDVWKRVFRSFCKYRKTSSFRVADVGCGPGFLLWSIEGLFPGAKLVAINHGEELLRIARSRCKKMTARREDASAIPLSSGYADAGRG
jgi:ubiquinone/menaquinone biosynthesis C-methylase UbiE